MKLKFQPFNDFFNDKSCDLISRLTILVCLLNSEVVSCNYLILLKEKHGVLKSCS